MKKTITVLIFVLFVLGTVFAWQDGYRASSSEYKTLVMLKNISGSEVLNPTFPVSGSQMLEMLHAIDVGSLPDYGKDIYFSLEKSLSEPDVLIKAGDVGFDLHTPVLVSDVWFNYDKAYKDVKDMMCLDTDMFFTENFYGKLNFNFTTKPGREKTTDKNLHIVTLGQFMNMTQVWPAQAYGSIGNDYFNFTVGRDRLSAGNGVCGNLYLSENQKYTDFAKFSFIKNPVSYDFTALAYDRFDENGKLTALDFDSASKYVFIHRFSSVLLKRISFSAYEGAVVYGKNVFSDIRALNPFMFIHNQGGYYSGNTNNFAGIEVGGAIGWGLSANLQVFVDQFMLSNEREGIGENAYGFLGDISGTWKVGNGILNAFAEGAYLTKPTYLKEKDNQFYNPGVYKNYMVDMINRAYHFWGVGDSTYMGYPLGGNVFAVTVGSSYTIKDNTVSAVLGFADKGPYGIGKNEQSACDLAPLSGYSSNQKSFNAVVSLEGEAFDGVDYNLGVSMVSYKNFEHVAKNDKCLFGFTASVTIDPLKMFIKRKSL